MKTLKTKRLILRGFCENDLNDFFEYSHNPVVGVNAGWKPHESIEESLDILKTIFLGETGIYAIVLENKVIGSAGLINDPKRENVKAKMLGYALGESYWGKGYMTEAVYSIIKNGFENDDINIISAYCYPDNLKSKRVIEKCGFKFEGLLRQAELMFNNKIKDNSCFSLIKEEWLKFIKSKF
jgi:putative acetyltransferase